MENNQDDISIKQIVQKIVDWTDYLKSKWKIVLLVSIIGGIIGFGYSLTKKTIYISKLSFALEEKGSTGGGLSSIAAQFGLGGIGTGDGGVFAGGNMIELLKSRFLIEKTLLKNVVINNKNDLLVNRYIIFNKLNEDWAQKLNTKDLKFTTADRKSFTLQHDSILGIISSKIIDENLKIDQKDKKLSIINITFKSNDEIFAKVFTENLIETVSDFYIETKTQKSRINVMLLESRTDSVQRELNSALYGRAQFGDQNLSLIRQQAAVPKLKQEIKVQMLTTLYAELVKNLEFAKLTLMREEPLVQIIDKPILPLPRINVSKVISTFIGFLLAGFVTISILILTQIWREIIR